MKCTTKTIYHWDQVDFDTEVAQAINQLINGKNEIDYELTVQYSSFMDLNNIVFTAHIMLIEEED